MRVAVFSTGDEIVEPGKPRPGAALFDANRYLLTSVIERLGATATDLGILPDDPERLARAIAAAAAEHDLVVTSGGVSTGEADHVRHAVEAVGRLVFWRVAIKPGRPVAMGVIPGGGASAAFVGLPGNPAAVYVRPRQFPHAQHMTHRDATAWLNAPSRMTAPLAHNSATRT